jgi:hypothetical protein
VFEDGLGSVPEGVDDQQAVQVLSILQVLREEMTAA